MNEWPKTLDYCSGGEPHDTPVAAARCEICGDETQQAQVVPADLARELAEALKGICEAGDDASFPSFEIWAEKAYDLLPSAKHLLARYEREVGS